MDDSIAATSAVASADNAYETVNKVSAESSVTNVKLLIKSANQLYNDQIIESDLSWTVKTLKTKLSVVHLSKPCVEEQKLIYSGKLLEDTLQLKEIIRSYKDVYTHNHIIHLVHTPRTTSKSTVKQDSVKASVSNMSNREVTPNSSTSSLDGIRHRNVTSNTSAQQQHMPYQYAMPSIAQCPPWQSNNTMPFSFPGQYNMQQSFATQQAAMYNWMQQVYSQYMDQYMRLSHNVSSADNNAGISTNTSPQLPPFMPFLTQQLPFLPNAPVAPVIPTMLTPNHAGNDISTATTAPPAPAANEQAAPQADAAPNPRFRNMPEEEQDNRDWLDNFFSATRLLVFLSILYLNSSPMRCLIVCLIAGGIYLYHIGVFRVRRERNNNIINRDNNAVAEQIRQGLQNQQQVQDVILERRRLRQEDNLPNAEAAAPALSTDAADGAANNETTASNRNEDGIAGNVAEEAAVANNNANTALSFVRTFVVTFFTSLLPETPAL